MSLGWVCVWGTFVPGVGLSLGYVCPWGGFVSGVRLSLRWVCLGVGLSLGCVCPWIRFVPGLRLSWGWFVWGGYVWCMFVRCMFADLFCIFLWGDLNTTCDNFFCQRHKITFYDFISGYAISINQILDNQKHDKNLTF